MKEIKTTSLTSKMDVDEIIRQYIFAGNPKKSIAKILKRIKDKSVVLYPKKYQELADKLFRDVINSPNTIDHILNNSSNQDFFAIFNKIEQDIKINTKLAINLCNHFEEQYGKEKAYEIQDFFSLITCSKDNSLLLVYDKNEMNESIIVKDEYTGDISFITELMYKKGDCGYYNEEDYRNLQGIEKFHDMSKILNILYQSLYEVPEEYIDKYPINQSSSVDTSKKTKQTKLKGQIQSQIAKFNSLFQNTIPT